jgi:hypothetical protein
VRVRHWAGVLALALAAAGCADPEPAPAPAADLSPDGIAAVVADHLDETPRRVESWDVMTRELGVESPGAALVFPRNGYFLGVSVAPTTDSPLVCATKTFFDECVTFDHDGVELVLAWQELEPEEDPGVVFVIDRRDGEDVVADYSGVSITGDPRELDLGITVEEMADVVTDERLTLG